MISCLDTRDSPNLRGLQDLVLVYVIECPWRTSSSYLRLKSLPEITKLIRLTLSTLTGNLLVICLILATKAMRNRTNLLLLNLAFADFGVAVFCIYQNMSFYLMEQWIFGQFFCKMYHFVHALSYTASIFFLVLMSIEKFLAIALPMWSKRVVTRRKITVAVISCWIVSILYCSPRLLMFGVVEVPSLEDPNVMDSICILRVRLYDTKVYDVSNFIICFIIPLVVMSILYTIMSIRICQSASELGLSSSGSSAFGSITNHSSSNSRDGKVVRQTTQQRSAKKLLDKRRRVIKLLVMIVIVFGFCTFPFYFRKMLQNFSVTYRRSGNFAIVSTVATNLLLYANSAANPFLYALYSTQFRETIDRRFMRRRYVTKCDPRTPKVISVSSTTNNSRDDK